VCVCVCVDFAVEPRTDPCSTSPNPTSQPSPPTGQINIFTEFASCLVIPRSVNYVLISPLFNTAIDRHLASYAYHVDEAYDTIRDASLTVNVRSKADMSQLNLPHVNDN